MLYKKGDRRFERRHIYEKDSIENLLLTGGPRNLRKRGNEKEKVSNFLSMLTSIEWNYEMDVFSL